MLQVKRGDIGTNPVFEYRVDNYGGLLALELLLSESVRLFPTWSKVVS